MTTTETKCRTCPTRAPRADLHIYHGWAYCHQCELTGRAASAARVTDDGPLNHPVQDEADGARS